MVLDPSPPPLPCFNYLLGLDPSPPTSRSHLVSIIKGQFTTICTTYTNNTLYTKTTKLTIKNVFFFPSATTADEAPEKCVCCCRTAGNCLRASSNSEMSAHCYVCYVKWLSNSLLRIYLFAFSEILHIHFGVRLWKWRIVSRSLFTYILWVSCHVGGFLCLQRTLHQQLYIRGCIHVCAYYVHM